jgi:hypothetical protein
VDEQLQVGFLGLVAGPLELDQIPLGQVAPQPHKRRWGTALATNEEEVASARQVADRYFRLDLEVVVH